MFRINKDGYQSQFLDMNVGFLIKINFPNKNGTGLINLNDCHNAVIKYN